MPAKVQTMAYYGDVPWHGLGKEVPKSVTAEEMIRAAGLDWSVQFRPARGAMKINRKGEFSRYEVVRLPRETAQKREVPHETGQSYLPVLALPRKNAQETEVLLGVVSRRYTPLQNVEAFEFFNPIVGDRQAYFETAGALGEGERIWVMARMPKAMEIVPGDECLKYLLLSNTHSGDGSVVVKFTSVRVICNNTLMMAMEDGQKAYRVRHSKQMHFKLDELADFLAITQEVFLKAEECFRLLARIQMKGDRLDQYLEAVFPRSEAQKKKQERPQRWGCLRQAFDGQPDLQLPGVQGTLWAAYNAITRFEDYKQPQQEEQPDQRLERVWFGGGADIKLRALVKAKELAAKWPS
jgi:phage/plasmid-like protein (TIGR03299 family)